MTPAENHARIDRLMDKAVHGGTHKPCCKKGCFHCCYEPAYADRNQIDYLIAGLSPEQIEEVKAKLLAWLEKTEQVRAKKERVGAFEYRNLNVPCPLLKDGLCSAYERRPTDCRIFFAIGNPDDCAMPARMKQRFSEFPEEGLEVIFNPWVVSVLEQDGEVILDHIGVLLAERLLGLTIPSASRMHIKP